MRRKHHAHRDEADINITPMLDIVFIMLIFFIVTTSFVKESSIDLSNSSSKASYATDLNDYIVLRIDASGGMTVNGRHVDARAVQASIQAGLAGRPGATVLVFAHREADAGLLVRAVDQARSAGATVSLATEAR